MKVLKILLATVAVLCVGRVVFVPLYCYDLGFHLATGRYILTHHRIPDFDPFSFTAPTGIWPLHQWLMGVVYYGVFHWADYRGVWVLHLALIAVLATLVFSSCKKQNL